jgi:hypothetical protein
MKTTKTRAFTVHEEKRLTGAFRLRKVDGVMQLQVEAVIEKTRTIQTRETYTTFRLSKPEDQELVRIKHQRSPS